MSSLPTWTCDEVVSWLSQNGFNDFCISFKTFRIDGSALMSATVDSLAKYGVQTSKRRKLLVKAVNRLKKQQQEFHSLRERARAHNVPIDAAGQRHFSTVSQASGQSNGRSRGGIRQLFRLGGAASQAQAQRQTSTEDEASDADDATPASAEGMARQSSDYSGHSIDTSSTRTASSFVSYSGSSQLGRHPHEQHNQGRLPTLSSQSDSDRVYVNTSELGDECSVHSTVAQGGASRSGLTASVGCTHAQASSSDDDDDDDSYDDDDDDFSDEDWDTTVWSRVGTMRSPNTTIQWQPEQYENTTDMIREMKASKPASTVALTSSSQSLLHCQPKASAYEDHKFKPWGRVGTHAADSTIHPAHGNVGASDRTVKQVAASSELESDAIYVNIGDGEAETAAASRQRTQTREPQPGAGSQLTGVRRGAVAATKALLANKQQAQQQRAHVPADQAQCGIEDSHPHPPSSASAAGCKDEYVNVEEAVGQASSTGPISPRNRKLSQQRLMLEALMYSRSGQGARAADSSSDEGLSDNTSRNSPASDRRQLQERDKQATGSHDVLNEERQQCRQNRRPRTSPVYLQPTSCAEGKSCNHVTVMKGIEEEHRDGQGPCTSSHDSGKSSAELRRSHQHVSPSKPIEEERQERFDNAKYKNRPLPPPPPVLGVDVSAESQIPAEGLSPSKAGCRRRAPDRRCGSNAPSERSDADEKQKVQEMEDRVKHILQARAVRQQHQEEKPRHTKIHQQQPNLDKNSSASESKSCQSQTPLQARKGAPQRSGQPDSEAAASPFYGAMAMMSLGSKVVQKHAGEYRDLAANHQRAEVDEELAHRLQDRFAQGPSKAKQDRFRETKADATSASASAASNATAASVSQHHGDMRRHHDRVRVQARTSSAPYPKALLQQRWFKANMTRKEAERLLDGSDDGIFLVRGSESSPGELTLSAFVEGCVRHIRLWKTTDGRFALRETGNEKEIFPDACALIHYHLKYRMQLRHTQPFTLKLDSTA